MKKALLFLLLCTMLVGCSSNNNVTTETTEIIEEVLPTKLTDLYEQSNNTELKKGNKQYDNINIDIKDMSYYCDLTVNAIPITLCKSTIDDLSSLKENYDLEWKDSAWYFSAKDTKHMALMCLPENGQKNNCLVALYCYFDYYTDFPMTFTFIEPSLVTKEMSDKEIVSHLGQPTYCENYDGDVDFNKDDNYTLLGWKWYNTENKVGIIFDIEKENNLTSCMSVSIWDEDIDYTTQGINIGIVDEHLNEKTTTILEKDFNVEQ